MPQQDQLQLPPLINPLAPQPQGPGPMPSQAPAAAPIQQRPVPPEQFQKMASIMAKKQGLDPELAHRLFSAESSWDPNAKSPKGAIGLGQLMPQTAGRLGVDPTDPVANMHGSLLEFKRLMTKYKDDPVKALGAYNAGETAIDAGKMPAETAQYVMKILKGYQPPDALQEAQAPMAAPGTAKTQGTIGPQAPRPQLPPSQFGSQLLGGLMDRLPNLLTPYDPVHGRQQLLQPQEMMTPKEQSEHPVLTGLGEFAGGMTTPGNIITTGATGGLGTIPGMAGKLIPRLVSAGFSLQMAKGLLEQWPQLEQAYEAKDWDTVERIGTMMGLTGLTTILAGEHALRGEAKPGPVDTSIQDARTDRRLIESQIKQERKAQAQQAKPMVKPSAPGAAEGPRVEAVAPSSQAGLTGAKEIGTEKGPSAKLAPETLTPKIEKPVQAAPVEAAAPAKPDFSKMSEAEIEAFAAGGRQAPPKPEAKEDFSGFKEPPKPTELAAAKAKETPAQKAPEGFKLETDKLGVRWAVDDKGVRISIPRAIKDSEIEIYAKGKLAEQTTAQAAIKEKVAEAAKPAPTETPKPTTPAKPPEKPQVPTFGKEGPKTQADWEKAAVALGVPKNRASNAAPRLANAYESAKKAGASHEEAIQRTANLAKKLQKEGGFISIGMQRPTALQRVMSKFNKAAGFRMDQIKREKAGEYARAKAEVENHLNDTRKLFDKEKSPELGHAFIDLIEDGDADRAARGVQLSPRTESLLQAGLAKLSPELRATAMEIKGLLNDTKTAIQGLGTGKLQHFIENYFPHYWKRAGVTTRDPGTYASGKRPLPGPARSLKARSIPTTLEGIDRGYEKVYENPVDQALATIHEQNRYIMAHRMVKDAKGLGIARFVKAGAKPPEGWHQVNDKIFDVKQYSQTEKGFIDRGKYYMPKEAAQVLNRYLSPGLQGHIGYDIVRSFSNALNQVQLGFSAYHFGTTTVNAVVSSVAQGLEQIAPGREWTSARALNGVKKIVSAPMAPFKYALNGARDIREYLNPQSQSAYAKALATAGGRISQDPVYSNSAIDKFFKAWRKGDVVGVLGKSVPSVLEAVGKPIMEWTVPTMKVGAFHDMAEDVFARATTNNYTHAQMREALQKAWDSVDNRFGQVVYDNIGWHNTAKDLMHVTVRSVGWNFGTFRELGGGLRDFGEYVGKGVTGQKPQLSSRAAYTIALPITLGIVGTIYQIMHTGQRPTSIKDMYFPKTGKKTAAGLDERVSLPSYMKDIFSWGTGPYGPRQLQTAENKLNPALELVYQMLANKDFYGKPIRHVDDPLMQSAMKNLKFVANQFVPLSARNWQTKVTSNMTPLQKTEAVLETGFGIAPASKEIERSDDQNLDIQRRLEKRAEGGKQLRPKRPRQTP